jgi:hypothetical protein
MIDFPDLLLLEVNFRPLYASLFGTYQKIIAFGRPKRQGFLE